MTCSITTTTTGTISTYGNLRWNAQQVKDTVLMQQISAERIQLSLADAN